MIPVLRVENLWVEFATPQGRVLANRGVSLGIDAGQTLGLVGESGCGKTVLAMTLLRLQQPGRITGGRVWLDSLELTALPETEMARHRGRLIGLVPQDLGTALNPVQTIGFHLAEASLCREGKATVASLWKASTWRQNGFYHDGLEALHRVGLPQPEEMLGRYPHQLSGGMRQRVLLALALLLQPRLLICDEPTTALDPETKAGILSLLEATAQQSTMLLISHDMVAIRRLANRVAVMYAGAIVEEGERRGVLDQPQHPYTQALLASQKMERGSPLVPIAGDVPDLMNFPGGCSFHTRCLQALPICSRVEPALNQRGDRRVACHLYG